MMRTILTFWVCGILLIQSATVLAAIGRGYLATVEKVMTGNLIEVRVVAEVKQVRYIGIRPLDADITNPMAVKKTALSVNQDLVGGKEVTLRFDRKTRGKPGEILAYVYSVDDSGNVVFVNRELVYRGYAEAAINPANTEYAVRLVRAMADAMSKKRGAWSVLLPSGQLSDLARAIQEISDTNLMVRFRRDPLDKSYRLIVSSPSQSIRKELVWDPKIEQWTAIKD